MTSTPAPPAGRREVRDGTSYVVLTRTFHAPVEDVWAAVTEPERLARWIGTWTGDPASGEVAFRMTAEGDGVAEETYRIDVCEPPRRLVLRTSVGDDDAEWKLELDLAESDGVTTLTFAQVMADPAVAENVGPGWDYYLDRLVAAESGRDASEVAWDDYYPARSEHYRAEFS
ncbi:SRPBCC family protein [Nocardioides lijunqiniae]|uniref:SRPBCC family protein n=1 Tax=Nocardioides lijunqiniae TaxID=2760832 RepID=UPI001878F599|nr:SRPBCC family protein [Nocardioides lijunqiniae]